MPICILLTALGSLPLIYADSWLYPVIGRFLIGVGSSAAILSVFSVIRMLFADRHFTRMLSLSVTIGLIGAIYGGGPVADLCAALGYQSVIKIFAVVGIILAIITYFIIPNVKSETSTSIVKDLSEVFTNKSVVMLCLCSGLMVGPLEGFADVWGSEFLKQVYAMDAQTANYLPSLIFLGMCFGSPILSLIAEKTGQYSGAIIISGILMLTVFIALTASVLDVTSISVGFVLIGISCAYQIIAIYKATQYVRNEVVGMTTAVVNMVIMSFGYAFHSIIGAIVSAYGGSENPLALIYGVSFISVCLAIAVVGFSILAMNDKKIAELKFLEQNNI
jgi:predicted MFS family arabinose efflux permease